jgi:hypothetical protein
MMWLFPALVLGVWAAFFIVGYAMLARTCPYERVALLLTVLATEVATVIFAYVLLSHFVFLFLATFALTKCITWVILVDLRKVVHFQLPVE